MNDQLFYTDSVTKIHYLLLGHGQPLLFLHGIGVSTKTYLNCLEVLSQKYLVIAPDLPGFGQSDVPPKAWGYKDYAYFFNQFLASLNIKNCLVAGHSFGGEIAIWMAETNPMVTGIVPVGASGAPVELSVWALLKIMLITKPKTNLKYYKNPGQLKLSRNDYLKNVVRKSVYLPRLAKTILRSIYEPLELKKQLAVPALIIWAKRDEVIKFSAVQKLVSGLSNHKIVEIDEYHDWVQYKPEILLNELIKWQNEKKY